MFMCARMRSIGRGSSTTLCICTILRLGESSTFTQIGAKVDINTINFDSKIVLVRNEVDYRNPARFADALNVYSRISAIKNTSFIFEGMLERDSTGEIIAENVAVHVWLNHKTNAPTPVPDEFRKLVQSFEGERLHHSMARNYRLSSYDFFRSIQKPFAKRKHHSDL